MPPLDSPSRPPSPEAYIDANTSADLPTIQARLARKRLVLRTCPESCCPYVGANQWHTLDNYYFAVFCEKYLAAHGTKDFAFWQLKGYKIRGLQLSCHRWRMNRDRAPDGGPFKSFLWYCQEITKLGETLERDQGLHFANLRHFTVWLDRPDHYDLVKLLLSPNIREVEINLVNPSWNESRAGKGWPWDDLYPMGTRWYPTQMRRMLLAICDQAPNLTSLRLLADPIPKEENVPLDGLLPALKHLRNLATNFPCTLVVAELPNYPNLTLRIWPEFGREPGSEGLRPW